LAGASAKSGSTRPGKVVGKVVAEERLTGIAPQEQPGSAKDLRMAREALARVAITPRLEIDSILPFTRLMIEHEWRAIQLIANQLMVHRRPLRSWLSP
jgi:hypothetical protein